MINTRTHFYTDKKLFELFCSIRKGCLQNLCLIKKWMLEIVDNTFVFVIYDTAE